MLSVVPIYRGVATNCFAATTPGMLSSRSRARSAGRWKVRAIPPGRLSLADGQEEEIPERYGVTPLYLHLRMCERHHWLSPAILAAMDPELLATLEANERLRQHEEAMVFRAKR